MGSVRDLFFLRLKKEWVYQYSVWKTAVDWVVALYILVPVLAILGYQYYLLWEGSAEWVIQFPALFYWLPLFFLSRYGTVRLFLREGDLLFLRQQSNWYFSLIKHGITYSLLRNATLLVCCALLLLPIWLIYGGASNTEIVFALCYAFVFQLFSQLGRQLLALRYRRWKLYLINILFVMVTFPLFQLFFFGNGVVQAILFLGFALACYSLMKKRFHLTATFFEDCLRENQERLKLVSIFIAASGYKIAKKQRKRPLILFSKSTKLFRKRTPMNLLAEIFIKQTIRNKTMLLGVLQITGVGIIAILLTPVMLKWVLLAVCLFAVVQFIKWGWRDMRTQPFFKLFPYKDQKNLVQGIRKAIFLLGLPSFFMLGLVTGWVAVSLTIGIVAAIGSVLFSYLFFIWRTWLY
ncbi:ABC transporter permease [Evansella tamaricis]|uniref:ABC transporter permease n=1 Tax=Evansella tamaricis TaxID=2069301 RepID=A0ABS6JDC0_9BACI|nr:ABC transporter permease [Evansella tamaricis]MBU9711670.1 ABC transporter permease [Evansella tamaricis]